MQGEVEQGPAASAGLAVLLNALRARILLWILLSTATLAAQAAGLGAWTRISALVMASFAALVGLAMAFGLGRHLARVGRGGGRLFGMLALIAFAIAIGVDAIALLGALGVPLAHGLVERVGAPVVVVLLGELVGFVALAPLALSHAGLAGTLDAMDIRRRASRAALLVLISALGLSAFAWLSLSAYPTSVTALTAILSGLLAVIALAKVLGATRILLAYLQSEHARDSMDAVPELRAWHRA